MRVLQASLATALAVAPAAFGQTFTNCDPTKKTCPDDTGLSSASYTADFTKGPAANASWSPAAYTDLTYNDQGALFSIAKQGQAPTIQSDFFIFFGRVEVTAKLAPGTGIVSSIVLQSDDLDEIDWEFLGADSGFIQTNFFGKGNTTTYNRMIKAPVSDATTSYHTYALDWTAERLQWIIDGSVVRTLAYGDAVALGGKNYPQTPMQIKLGNWAAGGEGEPDGVVQWAGGKTDFSQAPFNMYVKNVAVTNYNPADKYSYGDMSGSYQSIKKIGGSSSNSGSSSSGSASSASASGSNSTQAASTNTVAPTSAASVVGINQNTQAAVSVTQTGSSYSMNTESASALNAGNTANGSDAGTTTMTTAVGASTQVPGSEPTASGSASGTSSGGPATQTNSSGAAAVKVMAAGSLLSAVLGFWML